MEKLNGVPLSLYLTDHVHHESSKILLVFSITNWTAMFLACISVISRSMLRSRMMVGANTTAKFFGDI